MFNNILLPATGDAFNFVPIIIIAAVALVALVAVIILSKKNKK